MSPNREEPPRISRLDQGTEMKALRLSALLILTMTTAIAQSPLGFQTSDSIATVLKRQLGQRVELRLKSGEKLGGKVESVGEKLVHLSAVTGMEYYEAAVVVEDVSVVLVRAAK
jgi:small nuclear ribonucleoprotein (snRNP)-like protein